MVLGVMSGKRIFTKESLILALLTLGGFILGFFISSYDILTHLIFLSGGDASEFSHVFVFSGVFGTLVFMYYSSIVRVLKAKLFIALNYALVMIYLAAYIFVLLYKPHPLISTVGIIVMFPMNIFILMSFWRHCRVILKPEQTKKFFKSIESSLILGYVFSGLLFAFGWLSAGIRSVTVFVGISFFSVFVMHFLINYLHRNNPAFNQVPPRFIPVRNTFFMFFRSKYTVYLLLFGLFAAIITYLIHFEFIVSSWTNFSNAYHFSRVYGFFLALMFVFILAFDRLIIHKILYSHDSPFSLIIFPFLAIVAIVLSLLINLTMKRNIPIEGISLLFILVSIVKVTFETNKHSIQIPSLRTLFNTLDLRYRQIIFPRVEGGLVMTGLVISGGILWLLFYFELYSSTRLLLIALALSLVWGYVTYQLIRQYVHSMDGALKSIRLVHASRGKHDNFEEKMRKLLVLKDQVKVINALRVSSVIQPLTYERNLKRMIAHPDLAIKRYVFEQIARESLINYLPELKNFYRQSDDEIQKILKPIIEGFECRLAMVDNYEGLESKLMSPRTGDRVMAAEYVGVLGDERYFSALVNLSREFEPEVKNTAIKTIARMGNQSQSYLLIEFLNSPEYYAYAFEALIDIGDPAIEYLERLYNTPHADEKTQMRIVRIYGKIATNKAVELLLTKLENQSRAVFQQVILALKDAKFQASTLNINRVLNVLVKNISSLAQNLMLYYALGKHRGYKNLRVAFENEIEDNYRQLFALLSLAYNHNTISTIEQLTKNGSRSDVSHAIEMLDMFIYDDIKPVLFPLLEDISLRDRIRKLQFYFPIERMSLNEVVSAVLTRDFNQLSLYPRACAMMMMIDFHAKEVIPELMFCLYHPSSLLRETAAYVIEAIEPGYLQSLRSRIDPKLYDQIQDEILRTWEKNELMLINKYQLLKNTDQLGNITEDVIVKLAGEMNVVEFTKDDVLKLSLRQKEFALFFIIEGKMKSNKENVFKVNYPKKRIFYSRLLLSYNESNFTFLQDTKLGVIHQSAIDDLLFDHVDLARCLLTCVEEFKNVG